MTEKKTEAAPGTAGPAPNTPPRASAPGPQDGRSIRRVGSVTLGLCLIAVGICFLCYYFLPVFNWLLVVKIGAPVALIALGAEVLWCASHPGRWKYDFLAVLGCLVLMGGAFCLTLLPLFWQTANPTKRIQLDDLGEAYESSLYQALEDQVELNGVDAYLETRFGVDAPRTLEEIDGAGVRFWLDIDLYGPYEGTEAFAADCARVMEAVRAQGVLPDRVNIEWESPDRQSSLELNLDTPAKMAWSTDQMAQRTEVWAAEAYPATDDQNLDQENSPDSAASTAPADHVSASDNTVQPSDQAVPAGENTRYPDEAMVEAAA